MKKKKKSIFLIDGNIYLYKSFYTFPFFKNLQNEPTGAIYGIIQTLKKIFNTYKPKEIIMIFDSPIKNFRKNIFPSYKANRSPIPKLLKKQIHSIYKIIKIMGIPIVIIPKVEADDTIGSIAKKEEKKGKHIYIISPDKDLNQLINKNISIIRKINGPIIDIKRIKKEYKIQPKKISHFLALVGDPVDNIPGVYGIGKKTAIILLKKMKTIDNIYKNINKIKEIVNVKNIKKIVKQLKKEKKNVILSKKLTTIKTNIIIKNKKELKLKKPNKKKMLKFFKKNNFVKWKKKVEQNAFFI